MSEIIAAIDEGAANDFLDTVVAGLGPQSTSGSSSLGPFAVSYSVSGTLSNGTVDLIPPGTIRIADLRLDWSASATLSLDLGDFLPEIHIPQVCIDIPCVGTVCTPRIDITWAESDSGQLAAIAHARTPDARTALPPRCV